MKNIFTILLILLSLQTYSQTKLRYLENNRLDVTSSEFDFPQKEFKIMGFGAYHGSAKTEQTEHALLKSLTKDGTIKYYLPETDFSIAHYFNQYLKTGDSILLKDLVQHYGLRVPQEQSIETYKKWQGIKNLNDKLSSDNKLTVVGIDYMVSYKYASLHLLEIIDLRKNKEKSLIEVSNMVKIDTTDYSPYYDSYSKSILKNFVAEYEKNPSRFNNIIRDQFIFQHLIKNLKITFDEASSRENVIYENYMDLSNKYDFSNNPQFLRYGFGHLEKEREGNSPSFFTMLIENKIYLRTEVLSVIGYLTISEVLWDLIYDENGDYESFTTETGFGIGDYEKKYFRGIELLKESKISDITLFRLNTKKTPYNDGIPDLIEVIMTDEKSNGEQVKGKSTTDFLDYAILISNSKANTPIQEMN